MAHNCRNTKPSENAKYWHDKIIRNKARDMKVTEILQKKGWKVIRLWECELNKKKYYKKLIPITKLSN